jgi:hypothetical protein
MNKLGAIFQNKLTPIVPEAALTFVSAGLKLGAVAVEKRNQDLSGQLERYSRIAAGAAAVSIATRGVAKAFESGVPYPPGTM